MSKKITPQALDMALAWSKFDKETKDDLARVLLFNPRDPHMQNLTDSQRQLRNQIVENFSLEEIALAASYPLLRMHANNMK